MADSQIGDKPLGSKLQDMTSKLADQLASDPDPVGFEDADTPLVSPEPQSTEVSDTSEVKESTEKSSDTKEGGKEAPPTASEDDPSLPAELKTPKEVMGNEEALKRVKGFQSAFTKARQELEGNIRKEYEQKFNEVLARLPQVQQTNQVAPARKTLADFFPNAPKEQLEPLEQAISAIVDDRVESRTAPLREENQQLKSYMNQNQANQVIQQQFVEAKKEFPEIETRMDDLVAWSMSNPQVVKGKSIKEMYMYMTYAEQFNRGKEIALKELKKKERESLETDSVPNTVSNKKPKTLAEAAELALREVNAKYKK